MIKTVPVDGGKTDYEEMMDLIALMILQDIIDEARVQNH